MAAPEAGLRIHTLSAVLTRVTEPVAAEAVARSMVRFPAAVIFTASAAAARVTVSPPAISFWLSASTSEMEPLVVCALRLLAAICSSPIPVPAVMVRLSAIRSMLSSSTD